MLNNAKQELKSIPFPLEVMKQIGAEFCFLPKIDEFRHVLVCIDYFSKWLKAKPTCDKSSPTVALVLNELTCRQRCFAIPITDSSSF